MSQFYVWDENNVNIQNSSDFLNDNQRKNGFASGTPASSSKTNTALRQATLITAALMEMLTNYKDNSNLTVQSSINDVRQAILNGFENFNATNMTVDFTSDSNREALLSGETLSDSIGKISSWLSALNALAFKATVSTSDIVNSAITSDKIASNAVTSAKLVSNSITNSKIADRAVTNAKIADGAITTTKIATKTITTEKFADSATCPRATYAGSNVSAGTIDARLNALSSRLDALGFKKGDIMGYISVSGSGTAGIYKIGEVTRQGNLVYGVIYNATKCAVIAGGGGAAGQAENYGAWIDNLYITNTSQFPPPKYAFRIAWTSVEYNWVLNNHIGRYYTFEITAGGSNLRFENRKEASSTFNYGDATHPRADTFFWYSIA